ncbi:hypothetical protein V3C99_014834 [Haemonchus contortus]|uniref:G_PROTEIN_RECEP_F1_2 domain-containing protein n=1 Tax=Haemonchus contortus TaxID=6289 RepID=A0A7I4YWI9_HAECO
MFLTLSDMLYMICITANGLLGICANCFLLYMIVYRSPPQLTPYRIFLANTALTQLLYALVMLMVEPKIYSHEMRIVVVYLGPAQYFGPWVCYMLLIVMLHLAVNSFISIMLSMIFRCVAVLTLGFPTSAAYAMCTLGYFVPLTMVLGAINMEYVSDYESNDNYMNHTVKYLEHYRTVVGTRVDQACILWVTFCVTFLLVPIYAVMYLCRWKIHHTLSKPTFVQHPSTKVYVRRLVKALTVQATVPLFTVFPASISYMLTQFGMVHYHFYCYFITSCLSIATLVDPIVTIYYVSPYRRFVKRCLGWCQKSSRLKRSPSEKSSSSRRSFSKVLQVAEK